MQKNDPLTEESSHLRSSTDTKMQKNDSYSRSSKSLLIDDHTPGRTESEADNKSSSGGISRFGSQILPETSSISPPPSSSSLVTNQLYPTSLDSEYEELLNDYELCAGLFSESAERVYKLRQENTALRLVRKNRLDLLTEVAVHYQHSSYSYSGFPIIDDSTSLSIRDDGGSTSTGGFMNDRRVEPSRGVPVTSPTAVDDKYQRLMNDYTLCFAYLEDSLKRADMLSEENAALRLVILDLEHRLTEVSANDHQKIHSFSPTTFCFGHGTAGFGIITPSCIYVAVDGCETGTMYDNRDHTKKESYIEYDSPKLAFLGNQKKQPQIAAICSGSCYWYRQIIRRLIKKIEDAAKSKNGMVYTPHSAATYAHNFMNGGYRDPTLPEDVNITAEYADILFTGFVGNKSSMFLATHGGIKEVCHFSRKLQDGEKESDFYWSLCTVGTGGVPAGDVLLKKEKYLAKDDNPWKSTSKVMMKGMKRAVRKDPDISIGYLTPKGAVVEKYNSRDGYKKVSTETYNNLKRKAPDE
ncbi:hypothetical protein MKX03_028162 [Papaver bracteatum]|nr:hypothetical protein MKX03_028162 [Papaver bracteatum]